MPTIKLRPDSGNLFGGTEIFERRYAPSTACRTHCVNIRIINCEYLNCDPPDQCLSTEFAAIPEEVRGPIIKPRMIKPHESPGRLIHPGDVRPFMSIAMKTGEGQII
jgi:hypothetical protein